MHHLNAPSLFIYLFVRLQLMVKKCLKTFEVIKPYRLLPLFLSCFINFSFRLEDSISSCRVSKALLIWPIYTGNEVKQCLENPGTVMNSNAKTTFNLLQVSPEKVFKLLLTAPSLFFSPLYCEFCANEREHGIEHLLLFSTLKNWL